jgi:hypothetical protein
MIVMWDNDVGARIHSTNPADRQVINDGGELNSLLYFRIGGEECSNHMQNGKQGSNHFLMAINRQNK